MTAAALLAGAAGLPAPLGAQGAPAVPGAPAADSGRPRAAAPDVRFMQQMIGHHAQAITMAGLVPAHSARADVRRVAERIAAAQGDEIALMRRWLVSRGAPAPAADAPAAMDHPMMDHPMMGHPATDHDTTEHAAMPGMLTPGELAQLGTLRGAAFDRRFLTSMIRHHEGALVMVAELFGTPGAAQDPEAFRLASDVDADQRAEIRRMRLMLAAPNVMPSASPDAPRRR